MGKVYAVKINGEVFKVYGQSEADAKAQAKRVIAAVNNRKKTGKRLGY